MGRPYHLLESLRFTFTKIKGAGPNPFKYVLIVHPSTAIHELHQKALVSKRVDVYRDRCIVTQGTVLRRAAGDPPAFKNQTHRKSQVRLPPNSYHHCAEDFPFGFLY